MNQPHEYRKGDRVRDIYTGEEYTVKRSYWQNYAGGDTSDYTVEFEPTAEQPTPWNKSRNLERVVKLACCPDCGEPGESKGHQTCQYPQD